MCLVVSRQHLVLPLAFKFLGSEGQYLDLGTSFRFLSTGVSGNGFLARLPGAMGSLAVASALPISVLSFAISTSQDRAAPFTLVAISVLLTSDTSVGSKSLVAD